MLDIHRLLILLAETWPPRTWDVAQRYPVHGHSARINTNGDVVLMLEIVGDAEMRYVYVRVIPPDAPCSAENVIAELIPMVEKALAGDDTAGFFRERPAPPMPGRSNPRPHGRGIALPESQVIALLRDGSVGMWIDPMPKVGDRLFVKETWQVTTGREPGDLGAAVRYRVDGEIKACVMPAENPYPLGLLWGNRWRASTTMPEWASRITVEVADVGDKVVRLNLVGEMEEKRILAKKEHEDVLAAYGEVARLHTEETR